MLVVTINKRSSLFALCLGLIYLGPSAAQDGAEVAASEEGGSSSNPYAVYAALALFILIVLAVSSKQSGGQATVKQSVPSANEERAARAARLARFGGGGDTSMPTEAELRERKTVSIAARNQKAAQEDAQQGGEEVAKQGQIGNKGKEGNTYWGGDSTMFEGKDD